MSQTTSLARCCTRCAGTPRSRATFTKFEDSTQEEWVEIIRQLPLTQAMAGQNVIDQLRAARA